MPDTHEGKVTHQAKYHADKVSFRKIPLETIRFGMTTSTALVRYPEREVVIEQVKPNQRGSNRSQFESVKISFEDLEAILTTVGENQ
jgi:hypothetical protein